MIRDVRRTSLGDAKLGGGKCNGILHFLRCPREGMALMCTVLGTRCVQLILSEAARVDTLFPHLLGAASLGSWVVCHGVDFVEDGEWESLLKLLAVYSSKYAHSVRV